MAIPRKDVLLLPFAANFDDRISADPATFELTLEQAAAFHAAHLAYRQVQTALMLERAEGTRSESRTRARDDAKTALLAEARQLYAFVQANRAVSDADKMLLGVRIRSGTPSRPRTPTQRPLVQIAAVDGCNVTIRIFEQGHDAIRPRRPADAAAAWVYSFVGEEPPADPKLWRFEGAATKGRFEAAFPNTLAIGTRVWLLAAWVSREGRPGPASPPAPAYIHPGGMMRMTKLAA